MYRPTEVLRNERGVALVVTVLMLTLFLTLAVYGLVFSTLDARIANNHVTSAQALNVAESGLVDALRTINRLGVTDFQKDVVQHWNTLFNPNPRAMSNSSQQTYRVTVTASAADPSNAGTITVAASGQSRASRTIVAQVRRMNSPDGRGALYLASDNVDSSFSGSAFEIDGNDHDLAGQLVSGGIVKPGIATRNDAVNNEVRSELNAQQIPGVRGTGFSLNPLSPSVITGGGPSVGELNQIISDILSRPNVQTINSNNIAGGTTLGTISNPQITHLTSSSVTLSGNVSGCGILIADGSVRITGNTDFIGWIIVRGETEINATSTDETTVLGNANILGSLWTGDLNVKVGGSAIINYSTAALKLADMVDSGGNPVPRPVMMTSWMEVY